MSQIIQNMIAMTVCSDVEKKKRFRDKVSEYMTRAEQIKDMVKKQKEEGKYHEQIHIQVWKVTRADSCNLCCIDSSHLRLKHFLL